MAALVEFLKNNQIEHSVHDSKFQIDIEYEEVPEPLVLPEGEEDEEDSGEDSQGEETIDITQEKMNVKIQLCEPSEDNEEEGSENE